MYHTMHTEASVCGAAVPLPRGRAGDMYVPYIFPQESGGRAGADWLALLPGASPRAGGSEGSADADDAPPPPGLLLLASAPVLAPAGEAEAGATTTTAVCGGLQVGPGQAAKGGCLAFCWPSACVVACATTGALGRRRGACGVCMASTAAAALGHAVIVPSLQRNACAEELPSPPLAPTLPMLPPPHPPPSLPTRA